MQNHLTLWNALEDWIVAIIVGAITLILVPLVRSLASGLSRSRQTDWQVFLSEVSVPISRLIIPIGLQVFIEVAPLGPKQLVWLENAAFLFFIIILVGLFRRTALWSIAWFAAHQRSRNAEMTLEHGFIPLLKNVVTLIAFLSGGMTILKHFGYDVMSLVAALGVGSLAVGLAAKDTLSNMISGFMLIIDRNMRPGDRISIGGVVGRVQEIGLRSTRLDLRDGNILIVPNQDFVNSRITNLSMTQNQFGATSKFRVPLSIPFERVRRITLDAIQRVPKAQKDRGSSVLIASLADGQQLISASFGIADPDDQAEALSQLHELLISRFSEERIPLLGELNRF